MNSFTRKTHWKLLGILVLLGFGLSNGSCTDPKTTDSTKFALFYPDVINIGPSMGAEIPQPTYIGGQPSKFEITDVKFEGSSIASDSFTIDENTGRIQVTNTHNFAVGVYKLSLSCYSNNKYYELRDVLSIHMMKAIPAGIEVEPSTIQVDYKELITATQEVLPTAKVVTDGDHIAISKYKIASVYHNEQLIDKHDFVNISADGVISLSKVSAEAVQPGVYTVSLKLVTAVVGEDSEEGIFEKALTIDVTSKPLSLTYTPNEFRVEQGSKATSAAPAIAGSTTDLVYALKSVEPANEQISINPATGELTLNALASLAIGSEYQVSVTATNKFGAVDFDQVLKFTIVDFIQPITKFTYADVTGVIAGSAFENSVKEMDGDEVTYAFVELDPKLADLRIDQNTGLVSANKGHKIPTGTHTVRVKAQNTKGELEHTFKLQVVKNPYFFSYVHWGNNLDLANELQEASQYRVKSEEEYQALVLQVKATDIPEGVEVKYTVDKLSKGLHLDLDAKTGEIALKGNWTENKVLMAVITAVTGKDTPGETVVKTPVFIHCSGISGGVSVEYTPFVFKVNPREGGYSAAPVITGLADPALFIMEYRRAFDYYNINGPASHIDGQPNAKNEQSFMSFMWRRFFESIGAATVNYGARRPMTYSENVANLGAPIAYVDPSNAHKIKINPNKWTDENGYANGVLIGQMTFVTNGTDKDVAGSKNQIFPLAVWFNPSFK